MNVKLGLTPIIDESMVMANEYDSNKYFETLFSRFLIIIHQVTMLLSMIDMSLIMLEILADTYFVRVHVLIIHIASS